MAVYSVATPISWPSTLPNPQVIEQNIKKNPSVLESSAGVPTLSKLVNKLSVSYARLAFVCTAGECQDVFYFYQSQLFSGVKPVLIGLRVEDGFKNVTARLTMDSFEQISEQHYKIVFNAQLDHRVFS